MRNLLNIFLLLAFSNALSGQCLQLQNCPMAPVVFCDSTANDSLQWNNALFAAPTYLTNNLPEGEADLCFAVSDTCTGANLDIQYLLFLDLDGNGDRETVVSSADLPPDVHAKLPTATPFRTFLVHGTEDTVVPLTKAKEAYIQLKKQGLPVEHFFFPGGHEVPVEAVEKIGSWITSQAG